MMRVGIFSGTFDPVHEGHIAFAEAALKTCRLDKVFFLVEPRPRRKQGVRAFEHRQQMVQLAIADSPLLGSIVLEQSQFTAHETLPLLQARFKGAELSLLMGDDMLEHLGDWPHVDELLRDVSFIIGTRHYSADFTQNKLALLTKARGIRLRYSIFQAPKSTHASRKIRLDLKRGRLPDGLNQGVRLYIAEQGLYSTVDS